MQALDRCHCFRLQQNPVRHAFHPEDPYLLPYQFRQHLFFKTPKMRVHYVERHLDRIEGETVIRRHLQHIQMDPWVLVPRETNIAEFSRFPSLDERGIGPFVIKDPVRVFVPEHLVVLDEICLLYTSDAADEEDSVDLGGRRIIKKKKERQ